MLIKTKFNGFSIDGIRLYNDPATAAIIASGAGQLGTAAAVAAPTLATVAPTLATVAPTIAPTIPGIVGSAAPELAAAAPGITQGLTGAQAMSPEIAANMGQAAAQTGGQGIMQAAAPTSSEGLLQGLDAAKFDAVTGQAGMPTNAFPGQINATPTTTTPITPTAPNQISTAPTQPAAPNNTGIMPNVSTTATPEMAQAGQSYYGDIAANASNELNKQIAAKTAEAQLNPIEKGFSYAKKLAGEASQFTKDNPMVSMMGMMAGQELMKPGQPEKKKYSPYKGSFTASEPTTSEYTPVYQPTSYYAVGGPVEQMSAQNAVGANQMYPQSQLQTPIYSSPMMQRPVANNVVSGGIDAPVNAYTGEPRFAGGGNVNAFEKLMRDEEKRKKRSSEQAEEMLDKSKSMGGSKPYSRTQSTNSPYEASLRELNAMGKKYGIPVAAPAKTSVDVMGDVDNIEYAANGGIMHGLGGYSDGGRLLKGPGDGVSDSIPAVIGHKQPARLADGEFVIPARIVSELGNGSTEAGARQLYAMMERIQNGRKKSIGKGKVAVNSKARKHLPA